MQTSSFQTCYHLFFHFGAGTLTTLVFTLKETRPWHMAALQRFIPLGNIRRGVRIQHQVFMDELLQRQLLLNIDLNHTVYIQIIYWVGQHDIFPNISLLLPGILLRSSRTDDSFTEFIPFNLPTQPEHLGFTTFHTSISIGEIKKSTVEEGNEQQ